MPHSIQQPLPTELLLAVFLSLDGISLTKCATVCRHWASVIHQHDNEIWEACARRDFEMPNVRRFWSLLFPDPGQPSSCKSRTDLQRSWKDMYRITRNWQTANYSGFFPQTCTSSTPNDVIGTPCCVVGEPQEDTFLTTLTISSSNVIVRSNPVYRSKNGRQCIQIQCPQTRTTSIMEAQPTSHSHAILCHYSHPLSNWLVTGGLDGTVALWDLQTGQLSRIWEAHRGRVLCVTMNERVVISGGSDSKIRVWDIKQSNEMDQPPDNQMKWTTRRGVIDISPYLSSRSDWYEGIGEVAVQGHLLACAPDAAGPVLVFSLLTGSLVYELPDRRTGVVVPFTRLCMTPFFLLTKAKVTESGDLSSSSAASAVIGTLAPLDTYPFGQTIDQYTEPSVPLFQSPRSTNKRPQDCVSVWDLQNGKLAYQLVPNIGESYSIIDIRVTPDFSKVFACIEIHVRPKPQQRIYCWDFAREQVNSSNESNNHFEKIELITAIEIDSDTCCTSETHHQTKGKSWACFM